MSDEQNGVILSERDLEVMEWLKESGGVVAEEKLMEQFGLSAAELMDVRNRLMNAGMIATGTAHDDNGNLILPEEGLALYREAMMQGIRDQLIGFLRAHEAHEHEGQSCIGERIHAFGYLLYSVGVRVDRLDDGEFVADLRERMLELEEGEDEDESG